MENITVEAAAYECKVSRETNVAMLKIEKVRAHQ
jgi:hypothetical protein